jgi:hypothetical protein
MEMIDEIILNGIHDMVNCYKISDDKLSVRVFIPSSTISFKSKFTFYNKGSDSYTSVVSDP